MFLKVITFFNSIVQEARTLNSDNVQNAVWHGHSDFHVIGNQVVFSPIASGKSSSSSWKMLPPWRIQSSHSKESAVITVTSDSDLEDQQTWSQEDSDSVPLMKLGPWSPFYSCLEIQSGDDDARSMDQTQELLHWSTTSSLWCLLLDHILLSMRISCKLQLEVFTRLWLWCAKHSLFMGEQVSNVWCFWWMESSHLKEWLETEEVDWALQRI
jgi:hypothetical protein